ncbi:hypothetical protein PFISCL1PPCAC_1475, partial [Pristionchus fissidentatus]
AQGRTRGEMFIFLADRLLKRRRGRGWLGGVTFFVSDTLSFIVSVETLTAHATRRETNAEANGPFGSASGLTSCTLLPLFECGTIFVSSSNLSRCKCKIARKCLKDESNHYAGRENSSSL